MSGLEFISLLAVLQRSPLKRIAADRAAPVLLERWAKAPNTAAQRASTAEVSGRFNGQVTDEE
jgi:hypothetical protein